MIILIKIFINYIMVFLLNIYHKNLLKKLIIKLIFKLHILYKTVNMFKKRN